MLQPGECSIRTVFPRRSVIASSGCDTRVGVTCALPPPCTIAVDAFGPSTTIELTPFMERGRTGTSPMDSLRKRTMEAADARRNTAVSAASSRVISAPGGTSIPPVRSMMFKMLRAHSRTSPAGRSPRSTASIRA